MYPLLATFIRYALLALAGHMATMGYFDASLVDAIASAGVAGLAIIWFMVTKKKPDAPDDPDYGAAS